MARSPLDTIASLALATLNIPINIFCVLCLRKRLKAVLITCDYDGDDDDEKRVKRAAVPSRVA